MTRLRYLFLTLMLTLVSVAMYSKNYVVAVGISDYPGTKNDLHMSSHDAQSFRNLYVQHKGAKVALITNKNATLKKVKSTMRAIFAEATSKDAIIFYFSGHGVKGSFVCYDGMLKYTDVLSAMGNSRAKYKMIFADACFSGDIRQNNGKANEYSANNVMFFLSSRNSEPSQEWRGHKNSVFTAFLLQGMNGAADTNHDRVVTAREIFNYVSNGIKSTKKKQHPVMWGRFDNNMPVFHVK